MEVAWGSVLPFLFGFEGILIPFSLVSGLLLIVEPLLAAIDEGLRPGHPQPNFTLVASQFSMRTCSAQVLAPLIDDWSTPPKIK